jgi:hypothetical protein
MHRPRLAPSWNHLLTIASISRWRAIFHRLARVGRAQRIHSPLFRTLYIASSHYAVECVKLANFLELPDASRSCLPPRKFSGSCTFHGCSTMIGAGALKFDLFPQPTIKWSRLTVHADPFWGRLPWLLERRGGNTASTGNQLAPRQRCCVLRGISMVGSAPDSSGS